MRRDYIVCIGGMSRKVRVRRKSGRGRKGLRRGRLLGIRRFSEVGSHGGRMICDYGFAYSSNQMMSAKDDEMGIEGKWSRVGAML